MSAGPCGCDESKELASEIEVLRLRLANGIAVMNARQAEYRAEIARLKAVNAELERLLAERGARP